MPALQKILFLAGLLLALPLFGFVLLACLLPLSLSGMLYLASAALIIAGLLSAPWLPKQFPTLTLAGLLALIVVASLRLIPAAQSNGPRLSMVRLPSGREAPRLTALIDEQDMLIVGEALFHLLGGVYPREHQGISNALKADYAELRSVQGVYPSPVLATYLGLQQINSFDLLLVEPKGEHPPETAVVFLHGFMGNVTAQCWEIAQAAALLGMLTACPSTEWRGEWRLPQGEFILRSTLEYLKDRGVKSVYLGGFSNGGFGISNLAPHLTDLRELRGLFFIDGIAYGENIAALGLPVLVLQGSQDERMPAAQAKQTAQSMGPLATYIEIESDHFVIMKKPAEVQAALSEWLKQQAAR